MINFFRRNKANINSLRIPNFDWPLSKEDKGVKQWMNLEQTMALSLNFFNAKPDIPLMRDVDQLRAFYRDQIVQQNGGLLQVDTLDVKGYKLVKTIFKIPQEPTGISYLSSLTIPFQKFSFVIKIQAPELGTTGIRDSVVVSKFLNQREDSGGKSGYDGWFRDPYSPEFKGGTLMNKSEEEIHDADFPDHPLSKVRKMIEQIQREVEFGSELEKAKKFNR